MLYRPSAAKPLLSYHPRTEHQEYICTPPKGCPSIMPSNTYLLLKKTLYGLNCSPRHWYTTAKQVLMHLNLKPCPNAPCIFTGTLIPDKPPLYVGMHVDDFLYFSSDPSIKSAFEPMLASENQSPS
jgi:hypothetical protein